MKLNRDKLPKYARRWSIEKTFPSGAISIATFLGDSPDAIRGYVEVAIGAPNDAA